MTQCFCAYYIGLAANHQSVLKCDVRVKNLRMPPETSLLLMTRSKMGIRTREERVEPSLSSPTDHNFLSREILSTLPSVTQSDNHLYSLCMSLCEYTPVINVLNRLWRLRYLRHICAFYASSAIYALCEYQPLEQFNTRQAIAGNQWSVSMDNFSSLKLSSFSFGQSDHDDGLVVDVNFHRSNSR